MTVQFSVIGNVCFTSSDKAITTRRQEKDKDAIDYTVLLNDGPRHFV